MLAGLIIWVGFLLINGTGSYTLLQELIIGIVSGGLIFFSGYRCYKIGGPRAGNIFRSALLLVLAVLSYFLIGITSAVVLLTASMSTSFLIFKTPVLVESKEIVNSLLN
jgi:hypothetical protein